MVISGRDTLAHVQRASYQALSRGMPTVCIMISPWVQRTYIGWSANIALILSLVMRPIITMNQRYSIIQ
jgi:hypothetical protein